MSVCIFLASDTCLNTYTPQNEYPVEIDVDNGIINDGGADDNYYLLPFDCVRDYSDKKFGVCLEWNYTDGRAQKLIEYIKDSLKSSETVELWKVWNSFYYEYDESPVIHKKSVKASELSVEDIKETVHSDIFNMPDKRNPDRPSFYCLVISR